MKLLLHMWWVGLLVGLTHAPARAELDRAALIRLSASVLRIEAPRSGGGFAIGSGVAVDSDKVITNCHVTRDAVDIFVVRGGMRWPVQGQLVDMEHDLCLLWVPRLQAGRASLGRTAGLMVGHAVSALGFTGGVEMQNSSGEVLALHRHDGAAVIQSSTFFSSGSSGGALFDEQGQLVGILTFRLPGARGHHYAAPAEWVQQMLDRATPAQYTKVTPSEQAGQPFWQGPATRQPRFLQAASLRREARWADLQNLAQDWLQADASDAEPWEQLALALDQQGQSAAAKHALQCAARVQALARSDAASRPVTVAPCAPPPR
jgi:serine protease Do